MVSAVEDAIVVGHTQILQDPGKYARRTEQGDRRDPRLCGEDDGRDPEQMEDPQPQITLEDARKDRPQTLEVGGEIAHSEGHGRDLGRIAAQLAKQVIFQKVREAERDTVYNEYIGRVDEVLNATVKRIEGPDVIFDMGKAEARMPRRSSRGWNRSPSASVCAWSLPAWRKPPKVRQVVVSRAAPELVQHLFQTEVPEIYDGTVVIRAIAREAGERTKIAVMSKDKDVDAVGACVGMKGMRVQSIIRELRGEKIDIIEYHEDAVTFAEKALQPAKVSRVRFSIRGEAPGSDGGRQPAFAGHRQEGPERPPGGQAAGLEDRHQERRREAPGSRAADVGAGHADRHAAGAVTGLGEGIIEKLIAAGITTVEALADMTPEQLEEIPGIGPKTVEKISIAVNNYFASLDAEGGTGSATEAATVEAAPAEAGAAEAGAEEASAADASESEGALASSSSEDALAETEVAAAEQESKGEAQTGEQESPDKNAAAANQ